MTFADRIKNALAAFEGRVAATQSAVTAITKERDDAIQSERETGTQLAAAEAKIAGFGDEAALESAVSQLEALAGADASSLAPLAPAPIVIPPTAAVPVA